MNIRVAKEAVPPSNEPTVAPYPEQLVLDWTDYCNAKCFFCRRAEYEQQIGGMGEFIPFAKLKKLERVLSNIKVFCISSGIGEPLLHPELEQILQWLYCINPSILLRTVTNGTALTAAKAPWFAGHLDWLSVSLNAATGEAHMRDMFPHLAVRGIDAEKRWELHLRHMREFIAALPPEDRPRIRFQMVAHRHNVKDIADFVRTVHSVGGSHAVITNIAAHAETVDWSLYWVKDLYNDAVDEACALGAQLSVRVDAARFYTSVKPVLDLNTVCRDPIDIAYISRSMEAAPCCHWAEAKFPVDIYNDEEGFERYWNNDVLRRLRLKRDFESCRVCGMSRVFDETSFHFSPTLKQKLIATGKLSQIVSTNDYPDSNLVRACVDNRLDLPSIRHTLSALNLPVEMSSEIVTQGPVALSSLEQACWEAFQKTDVPVNEEPIALAGPFLGIGWGPPIYEPQNKVSARWIGTKQSASIFVRATETSQQEARFTIHTHLPDLAERLQLQVNGRPVDTKLLTDQAGRRVISALLPHDLVRVHDGRIWLRIGILDSDAEPSAWQMSVIRFEVAEPDRLPALSWEHFLIEKNAFIARQQHRLAEQKQYIQFLENSRSWRLTAPLRTLGAWLRGCRRVVALNRRLRKELQQ
jgi:MoaA/NifB/PqqE/SkfB family radical SAM enzyme